MKHQIKTASVKVMRSYDYCHFEINLGINIDDIEDEPLKDSIAVHEVNELRKEAARLADRAVEQYKIAKRNTEKRNADVYNENQERLEIDRIRRLAETDRTIGEQAKLKAWDDEGYRQTRIYDYEDDWNE